MRKFNLQVAKEKGATDTQGNKVTHLTHLIQGDKVWQVFKGASISQSIPGATGHKDEFLFFVNETGMAFNLDGTPAPMLDLSTGPVKKEAWLNIYYVPPRGGGSDFPYLIEPYEYPSEEAALKGGSGYLPTVTSTYIRPVCVKEWEE